MSYYPKFAELTENHLAKNDRSSSWLANRLRVNPATVTRWLNEDTRPGNPETVVQIADVLKIEKAELLIAAGYGYQDSTPHEKEVGNAQPEPSTKLEQAGYYPVFSNLITQILTKRELPVSWLAKHLGIPSTIVSRWLNTETRPGNPELVIQIADILHIDKAELLVAAGYGYVEPTSQIPVIELEPNERELPKFKNQPEQQEYLTELTQSFGEKLSEYSKQRGYSQLELAQHLNVSPAAVSQWRTGTRIPNAKTVHKIVQTFGSLNQDETDQFLQAWTHSKLANDLSDYLAAASDDPMSTRALEKLLQNL